MAKGEEIVVSKDGPFTTISAAVAAAPPGSTIHIDAGDYIENVTQTKDIRLSEEGK